MGASVQPLGSANLDLFATFGGGYDRLQDFHIVQQVIRGEAITPLPFGCIGPLFQIGFHHILGRVGLGRHFLVEPPRGQGGGFGDIHI